MQQGLPFRTGGKDLLLFAVGPISVWEEGKGMGAGVFIYMQFISDSSILLIS
jgi:hypothetical protein